jgi:general secretion pathway protein G
MDKFPEFARGPAGLLRSARNGGEADPRRCEVRGDDGCPERRLWRRRSAIRRRAREQGFSLVELMVVIVIIGLLATIVIINVMPAADRAATTKARADISTLEQAVELYRLDHLTYPPTAEGLQALLSGNYIRRLPEDPWGNPYRYSVPGPDGRPFQIASWGADGREGGDGENADISN